jgi:hypothetical protein
MQHSLIGYAEQAMTGVELTLGHLEDFFMMPAAMWSGSYSWHSLHSCDPLSASTRAKYRTEFTRCTHPTTANNLIIS